MAANEGYVRHLASSGEDNPTEDLASGKFPVSDFFTRQPKRLAEVVAYYPRYNTYMVKPHGAPGNTKHGAGRPIVVPRKVENPNVVAPLEQGTIVVLDYSLGRPYIDGALNMLAEKDVVENSTKPAPNLTQNGPDYDPEDTTGNSAGYWRYPGMPSDSVEGDWAAVTPSGNYIAALLGKECTMFGSEMAQMSVFGRDGIARIICDQLAIWNSMGFLTMHNDGGRGKFKFKIAADQLTEFGKDNENWTFHLDIGDEGDFFNMRVTKPDGATLSRIYMSSDGRVEIMGINGVHIVNAGNSPRHDTDGGDVIRKIGGQLKETTAGAITQKTASKRVAEISEDDRTVVGHNKTTSVNNHEIRSVGGNQQITVTGGGPDDANPINVAVMMKVLNGGYILDIGNPLDGAVPSAMAGYGVYVHNGEITLGQDPLGQPDAMTNVSLNSLLPDSIALGCTVSKTSNNPATKLHAMLFEPFAILIKDLLLALDTHNHTTLVGPTTGLATPPFSASLVSKDVPLCQSIRVLIGL